MSKAPNRPTVKAVVFDKDGVLADSEAINLRSAFEVFRAHGYELEPEDELTIVGRHPVTYVPVLAQRFGMSEEEQRRVINEQDVIYTRVWEEEGRLFDDAREALDAVRRRGLGVGLATSSSRREVEAFLDRFELGDAFDVTLSLDDVKRPKPDPEIYVSAAERLEVPASEMVVVEDSVHGIRSAKGAGAVCVAVQTRLVQPEHTDMADATIDSVGDLLPLLDVWK
jgi:HAD superfamily hydrolase (TIGR01509 family)